MSLDPVSRYEFGVFGQVWATRGRVLRLLLAGAFVVAACFALTRTPASAAPAQPAPAKGVVTFGVQPASASTVPATKGKLLPDARPYFYYGVGAGASLTDHVAILNYSAKPLVLTVYATDALNGTDGSFGLLPAETTPKDAGSWVSLGGGRLQVKVPARSVNSRGQQVVGEVLLPVTLTVPSDATPGDHVGGIVASLDTVSTGANRVRLSQRVAARMFIRVSGPLHPRLSVQNLAVHYRGSVFGPTGGSATLTYQVRNDGNVKLGGRQTIRLHGLLGQHAAIPTVADIPLLLPGNSALVTVPVRRVWAQVRLTATVSVQAMQLPGDTNPVVPDARASVRFWAWPWLVLFGFVLLLLVILGLLFRRRATGNGGGGRHSGQPQDGPTGPSTEPTDDVTPAPVLTRTAMVGWSSALLVLGSLLVWPATAQAAPVPYTDPAVTGRIGLCDRTGHPVVGGKIGDAPFVWRAVSSVAAPAGYGGTGRKATLLAYQPRPGVAAEQWSGDQLTATSDYTNPAAPMAQATADDFTLEVFLGEFKPMVDGLLQLRMYFGIPGRQTLNSSYPATDIQVTGNTWHVVDPVSVSCTAGSGRSSELDTLAPPAAAAVTSAAPASSPSRSGSTSVAPKTSTAKGTSASVTATAAPTTRAAHAATTAAPSTATTELPAAASVSVNKTARPWTGPLIAIVLIIAVSAGGGLWWRRRRPS